MSAYENGLLLAWVVGVLVAALLFFSVAIFHLIYNAIPSIPWYWSPEETHQIGAPHNVGSLLPSEDKYKTDEGGRRLSTLSRFREKDFPLREALHQYHLDSISYALGLTEIEKEICEVTHRNDAAGYIVNVYIAYQFYPGKLRTWASAASSRIDSSPTANPHHLVGALSSYRTKSYASEQD